MGKLYQIDEHQDRHTVGSSVTRHLKQRDHPIGGATKITMVGAEDSSECAWHNPKTGQELMLPGGEPVGWIIELDNGFKIYHMGDAGLFGDTSSKLMVIQPGENAIL